MSISNTDFNDLKSTATTGAYGILHAKSLGQLYITSVTATKLSNLVATTAGVTTGGGRFLYIDQPLEPFKLSISGPSTFTCANAVWTLSSPEIISILTSVPT
jgi:hypothetical protein